MGHQFVARLSQQLGQLWLNAHVSNNWTDYLVQGPYSIFDHPIHGAAGIGGRLVDSVNGVHYVVWVIRKGFARLLGGTAGAKSC